MKKAICAVLIFSILFVLCGCQPNKYYGDVSEVKVPRVESKIYSQEDIDAAIEVIKKEFTANWKDCKLTEIYYAGDSENEAENSPQRAGYDGKQYMLLESTFKTGWHCDISLNKNDTYSGWSWLLVRGNGGQWEHIDHGYG